MSRITLKELANSQAAHETEWRFYFASKYYFSAGSRKHKKNANPLRDSQAFCELVWKNYLVHTLRIRQSLEN